MTQESRRAFLIDYLLSSSNIRVAIPDEVISQKRLLRALLNVRPPLPVSKEFLQVQDEGWSVACNRYEDFVKKYKDGRILYLELGVGNNTPIIIKYPFWRLTNQNPKATYACINFSEAVCPHQIQSKSVCIKDDVGNVLKCLLKKDTTAVS